MKRAFVVTVRVVVVLAVAVFIISAGGFILFQVPILILLGWIGFLNRMVPHIAVNWMMVGEAALIMAALGIGGHWFLAWLADNYGAGEEGRPAKRWTVKWTLVGLAMFLLMFGTSIAVTGMLHQTAWLVTATDPLTENNWNGMYTTRRLRDLSDSLAQCRARNGTFPKQEGPAELRNVSPTCTLPHYKDGWGTDFVYTSDGAFYVVKSLGKNRIPGGDGADGFDDIILSDGKFLFPVGADTR